MKALVQRVTEASVTIEGERVAEIGHGLLVFVGVATTDTEEDVDYLVRKVSQLRIFDDTEGVMNLNVQQVEGEVLVVSQFTLQAATRKGNRLFMFYAGAYNNAPQQVGVATSKDGIHWERISNEPFLRNGKPGEWNESESGHPHIFTDEDGRTYLFFQGNKTRGKDWFLSNFEVLWKGKTPYIKE